MYICPSRYLYGYIVLTLIVSLFLSLLFSFSRQAFSWILFFYVLIPIFFIPPGFIARLRALWYLYPTLAISMIQFWLSISFRKFAFKILPLRKPFITSLFRRNILNIRICQILRFNDYISIYINQCVSVRNYLICIDFQVFSVCIAPRFYLLCIRLYTCFLI